MAIRLAECAGLHRDGTQFGLSAVETHVRRLIWHQLCYLDIRVCQAVGPRPTIRAEEYDTKFPLNVDDRELESFIPPTQDAARFTEMSFSIIRFETAELSRKIWVGRPKVEKGEGSLTGLLRLVEEFRETASKKWMPIIDESKPLQAFAALMLQLNITGARISILHRYVVSSVSKIMISKADLVQVSTGQQVPERMTRLVWSSGTRLLEVSVDWQTNPAFKDWAWYFGAYQQWHVALLFGTSLGLVETVSNTVFVSSAPLN